MTADRIFTVFGYALGRPPSACFSGSRWCSSSGRSTIGSWRPRTSRWRVKIFVESDEGRRRRDRDGESARRTGRQTEARVLVLETRIKELDVPRDLLVKEIRSALAPIKAEADHFADTTRALTAGVAAVSGELGTVKTELAGVHASFKKLPEVTRPVEQGMIALQNALVEVLAFMRKATSGDRR